MARSAELFAGGGGEAPATRRRTVPRGSISATVPSLVGSATVPSLDGSYPPSPASALGRRVQADNPFLDEVDKTLASSKLGLSKSRQKELLLMAQKQARAIVAAISDAEVQAQEQAEAERLTPLELEAQAEAEVEVDAEERCCRELRDGCDVLHREIEAAHAARAGAEAAAEGVNLELAEVQGESREVARLGEEAVARLDTRQRTAEEVGAAEVAPFSEQSAQLAELLEREEFALMRVREGVRTLLRRQLGAEARLETEASRLFATFVLRAWWTERRTRLAEERLEELTALQQDQASRWASMGGGRPKTHQQVELAKLQEQLRARLGEAPAPRLRGPGGNPWTSGVHRHLGGR